MTDFKRLAASGLLGVGVLLVLFGLNAALGFTLGGAIASLAVIGALLYLPSDRPWITPRMASAKGRPAQSPIAA